MRRFWFWVSMRKLGGFLSIIMLSFFISFAIEPAVDWMAANWGWRRGAATGLVYLGILLFGAILIALVVPAIVQGFKQVISSAPSWIDQIARFLSRFGIHIDSDQLIEEIQKNSANIVSHASDVAGGIFSVGASIIGGIFRWSTIALFTFYIVAEGPKLRRVICSRLRPDVQERVLFVWDEAIEKTGGYFYSRLLLAVINRGHALHPSAYQGCSVRASLAIFEGVVAEFIPIIGTYIAGIPPVLVAFLGDPADGIIVLVWLLIYQQIENYILSPRLTARTMALHPAMAFAAALIGGALGGILAAFLALPVAGVIQAAVQAYSRQYSVVESDLTKEASKEAKASKASLRDKLQKKKKTPPN